MGFAKIEDFDSLAAAMRLVRPETFQLRAYQQGIAAKACRRNTLVILPTALGKTAISALVAAHFLVSYRDKRILVMAPTRPLVIQHRNSFLNLLRMRPRDAVHLTGKVSPSERAAIWSGNIRVIFATPQVVANDLQRDLNLNDFSLLVFDECHRATKDYAYTEVARRYLQQSSWPMILALTASPGASKEKISDVCKALSIEQIEHRGESDPDVAPYVNPVDIQWKQLALPDIYRKISSLLRELLLERLKRLSRMGLVRKPPGYVNRKDLLEVGGRLRADLKRLRDNERGPIYTGIITQSASLTLFHAIELLETQGISGLNSFLGKVEAESDKRSYRNIVSDPLYQSVRELVKENLNLSHPKMPVMKETVINEVRSNSHAKILVFTQYRDTATQIVQELAAAGISVERFVGQASRSGDRGLKQQEQVEMLSRFREGGTSVLVATSIAEEGLDIPSVELVIFYEPIPSEIRYIQRKGRTGRSAPGRVVILAASKTLDTAYLFASRHRAEKMKQLARTFNEQLPSLKRAGNPPEAAPMREDALRELASLPVPSENELNKDIDVETHGSQNSIRLAEHEKEYVKETRRVANQVWRKLYGLRGGRLRIEDLIDENEANKISPAMTVSAIELLEEAGKIGRKDPETVVLLRDPNDGDELYDVEVRKVANGIATVAMKDGAVAFVAPSDYEGPRDLLRKNARLKVRGSLYVIDGRVYLRIREVSDVM